MLGLALILQLALGVLASLRAPPRVHHLKDDAPRVRHLEDDATAPQPSAASDDVPPVPDDRKPLAFGTKFDGKLYANGEPFHIKGVNWYGTESGLWPPGGMEFHDVEWYVKFLAKNQFNAIRLLFNHKAVIDGAYADPGWPNAYPVTRAGKNSYLQMFLSIAKIAARHGVLVMMACHRLDKDAWPGHGLW